MKNWKDVNGTQMYPVECMAFDGADADKPRTMHEHIRGRRRNGRINVMNYFYGNKNNLKNQRQSAQICVLFNTDFEYDANGNRTKLIDAETHRTTNTYDGAGRLTQIEDPMTFTTQYEYDGNDNLIKKTDARSQVTEYEYDAYNQLTKIFYGGKTSPVKTITYTYDNAGNMLSWDDGAYSATHTYDELNRVQSVSTVYPFGTKTVSYTYDRFRNRATLTFPDTIDILTYTYDDLNRLAKIEDLALNTTQYEYDNANRLIKKTLPNSTYADYVFDNADRLTSLVNKKSDTSVLSTYTYTHDNVGNRLTMTTVDGTDNYGYDDIYRLTTADHPVQTDESYTYDKVGNRLTSAQNTDWAYDNNNRLSSYNNLSFTFDDNGNMISKTNTVLSEVTNYQYDYENRLTRIDYPDGTYSEYDYDSFGNRIKKDVNGTVTWFVYDLLKNAVDIIAEYNGSGSLLATYTHGIETDEMISINRSGNNYYYLKDGLGSVTSLTDNNEAVVNTYEYDAFGNVFNKTETVSNPYGFTGRRLDAESGLMYYRARYYDTSIGRFITSDPIGFEGGINFYEYVGNNPINWIDPLGLWVDGQCIKICFDDFIDDQLKCQTKKGTEWACCMEKARRKRLECVIRCQMYGPPPKRK